MKKTTLVSLIFLSVTSVINAGEEYYPFVHPDDYFIGPLVEVKAYYAEHDMRCCPKDREYYEKAFYEERMIGVDYNEEKKEEKTARTSIWEKIPSKVVIGLVSLGGDVVYRYILQRPFEVLTKKFFPLTNKEIVNPEKSSTRSNVTLGSRIAFDVVWFGATFGIAAACGLL